MYAQDHDTVLRIPAHAATGNPSRATLQARPPIQRVLIRSWEYSRPVRITVLAIRLLVVMWLFVLSGILVSSHHAVGWALIPAALAVFAFGVWVFSTAAKGWPVVDG
jgi:hypothetical protein